MKSSYAKMIPLGFMMLTATVQSATVLEVAFSIQGGQLTWFAVDNPTLQGSISATGLPTNFAGNALAYDPGSQRLLFVDGETSANHTLYAVSLGGLVLQHGLEVTAPAAVNVGTIGFGVGRELYGGGFYNGSYYTLINGLDSLVKVDFASVGGNIQTSTTINLPGTNTMYLGDLAFDSDGDLWISGFNQDGVGGVNDDRLWHFSTADGSSFTNQGVINPAGTRFNGIFFDVSGQDLYGYRLASNNYGIINQSDGSSTTLYTGPPFNTGGDLSDGFLFDVVPEPSSAVLMMTGFALFAMRRRH
ncbi:PEP-CTERM sorting domain-containing protein [Luteolibacter yonseiensis]|uniref:PEP-CTERM sorting domain-containing protein n=1 Tax=Luteolibacter yonseiensis TaxID=1144680 RepID=A0A934V9S0_9BACT|nr:PEP-CTERM sorting domain-containing protein [Luteolibacter yonseiensis]MBK1814086.1 PEP-CTERM sorting domain-containing protein [Luteolibacter yonseiensis]